MALATLHRDALGYLCAAEEEWLSYTDVARLALTCRALASRLDAAHQRRTRRERTRAAIADISHTFGMLASTSFNTRHVAISCMPSYDGHRKVSVTIKKRATLAYDNALVQMMSAYDAALVYYCYYLDIGTTRLWRLKESNARMAVKDALRFALDEHMLTVQLDRRASTLARMKRRVECMIANNSKEQPPC